MKGIVLAGGSGTRLHPLTLGVSKQLLPIYDKPMIFYPISILMLAGIKEILIISTPEDYPNYKRALGDGSRFGISLYYEVQQSPDGLAQAFIIGEEFIKDDNVCLILGDNFFYGAGLQKLLKSSVKMVETEDKAVIFGNYVKDPQRYGVVEIDKNHNAVNIDEKPVKPKSNYAVVGLYFYPNSVVDIAKTVKPSRRGELEITCINNSYLLKNLLKVKILSRGFAWLDAGTQESLAEATEFVRVVENRTGLKIACLEEIALINNYITKTELSKQVARLKGDYYDYIKGILS